MLREYLQKKFENSSLLVWYDVGGTLEPILEHITPQDVKLIRFDGSYLRIRVGIEKSKDLSEPRLIYVPREPLKESWLRDYELFGERLLMDLPSVLWSILKVERQPELELALTRGNCRALVSRSSEVLGKFPIPLGVQQLKKALLAAVFEQHTAFDVKEAVLQFVMNANEIQQKISASKLSEFFKEAVVNAGLRVKEKLDPELFAASILLAELAVHSEGCDFPGLEDVMPECTSLKQWAEVARRWASDTKYQARFQEWSEKVERTYGIQKRISGCQGLEKVESFNVIDDILLEEVADLIAEVGVNALVQHAPYINRVVTARLGKNWARSGIVKDWGALQKSLKLYPKIIEITKELEQMLSKDSPIIRRYFEEWWTIDQLYREFDASTRGTKGRAVTSLIEPLKRLYQNWLAKINSHLTKVVVSAAKWPPDGFLFQPEFWSRFIRSGEKTCLLFLDALRFELQKRLMEKLEERGHNVTHTYMLSTLPSVTEIGMSALLPHKQSINLDYSKGKLTFLLDDQSVKSKTERTKWLTKLYGNKLEFITLDKLGRVERKRSKKYSDVQLLVVWSTEIDRSGKFLSNQMLDYPDDLLEKAVRAIESAANIGFSKIIIATDHGFLFIPNPQEIDVIESFPKIGLVYARRYAVGHPPNVDGCIILSLKNIGYKSDGELLLPSGIAYLPRSGEKEAFIHGGLSLQECCIGVLEVKPKQITDRVEVKVIFPSEISSTRFKIRIVPSVTLTSVPRRIVVELQSKGRWVQQDSKEVHTTSIEVFPKLPSPDVEKIKVRIKDADTQEVIVSKTIPVTLSRGYDDIL